MSAHDLVIRNASLVDGTGAPARMADVAVSDGVITEVGPRLVGTGSREIDADGLIRRYPYPLRRASHMGPHFGPIKYSWSHLGRDG
ncbi:MAG: hypothetical protein RL628_1717 [Actinomycetota bacterium]